MMRLLLDVCLLHAGNYVSGLRSIWLTHNATTLMQYKT